MAELPEIAKLAGQMNKTLKGKTVKTLTLLQDKCANIPPDEFQKRITNAKVTGTHNKGKWIFTALDNGENILLSLGMGADILYFKKEEDEPEKYQIKVLFSDGTGYTSRFWWFGKFLLASDDGLATEPNTKDLAIDPFDKKFTLEYYKNLLKGKKTQVKAFLMNQKNVSGIGNMYMHDVLFKARLHPQKKISDINDAGIELLYNSIMELMNFSRDKGAFAYENDFFGEKGTYSEKDFLVGYREKQPCPVCGTEIISLKTGSTTSFICPACQKL